MPTATYLRSMERLHGFAYLPVLPGDGPELRSIQDIAAYYSRIAASA